MNSFCALPYMGIVLTYMMNNVEYGEQKLMYGILYFRKA